MNLFFGVWSIKNISGGEQWPTTSDRDNAWRTTSDRDKKL